MTRFTRSLFVFALAIAGTSLVHAQRITLTVAGTGVIGDSPDGTPAKNALISGPKDVCMDAAKNIYFADKGASKVKKISAATGAITTIAGGGMSIADGIAATSAVIQPNYMCIDKTGSTIYVTTMDHKVRKITLATGIITTVAGNGVAGFAGDGGLAPLANMNNPQGIAIDNANNLYIVDRGNHRIRKVTASSGVISTIAGSGVPDYTGDGGLATAAKLKFPVCIAVNAVGDVLFSDQSPNYPGYDNSIIRKIKASTGVVTTIAGKVVGGTGVENVLATDAILGTITGIYCCNNNSDCDNDSGDVITNEMSCACRKIDAQTDSLITLGGNFAIEGYDDDLNSPLADMNIPYGLCRDKAGNIYVADSNNHRIRKLIALTTKPTFAYGRVQRVNAMIGVGQPLDSLLWITDIDSPQTITWSMISTPAHGTASGFPVSAPSHGRNRSTKPTGLSYVTTESYIGMDYFKVRVTDGTLSDTITMAVSVNGGVENAVGNVVASGVQFNIFPNPVASTLNIEWPDPQTGNTEVVISDITDHVYYTETTDQRKGLQLDVAKLPVGVYFVKVNGAVSKFVKQ